MSTNLQSQYRPTCKPTVTFPSSQKHPELTSPRDCQVSSYTIFRVYNAVSIGRSTVSQSLPWSLQTWTPSNPLALASLSRTWSSTLVATSPLSARSCSYEAILPSSRQMATSPPSWTAYAQPVTPVSCLFFAGCSSSADFRSQEARLEGGSAAQIIGKVNPDLSIRVLSSVNLGTNVGMLCPTPHADRLCHTFARLTHWRLPSQ